MMNLLSLYKKALLGRVALAALLCFSAITSTAQAKVCFLPAGNCDVIPDSTSISSACPLGTSTSCGIGYDAQTTSTNGCYKCIKNCPSGQTSTPCEEGFRAEGTTTAGCHKCVKNNCDGFNLTKLPDSNSGWKNCKSCKTGTTTKYKCEAAACPSGSAVNKTCGSGWTVNNVMIEGTSTFAKSGDGICQKCVAKTCEVGGTDVSCKSDETKVSTGYKSGDSTCYACEKKDNILSCDIGYVQMDAEPTCYNTVLAAEAEHNSNAIHWYSSNHMTSETYELSNGKKCTQCYCSNVNFSSAYGGELNQTWYIEVDENGKYVMKLMASNEAYDNPVTLTISTRYYEGNELKTVDFTSNYGYYPSSNYNIKGDGCDRKSWDGNSCEKDLGKHTSSADYYMDILDSRFTIESKYIPDYKVVLTYQTYSCNDYFYEERAKCGEDNDCIYNLIYGNCSQSWSYMDRPGYTPNWLYYRQGEWYGEVYYKGVKLAEGKLDWDVNTAAVYNNNAHNNIVAYKSNGKSLDRVGKYVCEEEDCVPAADYGLDDVNDILGSISGVPYVSNGGVPFPILSIDRYESWGIYLDLARGEDTNRNGLSTSYNIVVPFGICDGMLMNINLPYSGQSGYPISFPLRKEFWQSNKTVIDLLNKNPHNI